MESALRRFLFASLMVAGLVTSAGYLAKPVRATAGKPLVTATFYMWYGAPDPAWVYMPPNFPSNGVNSELFWKQNLEDLASINIGGLFLNTFPGAKETAPYKDQWSHNIVKLAMATAAKYNIPMKYGNFLDFPHTFRDADANTLFDYHYTHDTKGYFTIVPKEKWLTHNNQPVSQGGRPVVMIWGQPNESSTMPTFLKRFRQQFTADFGVNPFMILENLTTKKVTDGTLYDAIYSWNSPIGGAHVDIKNNYKIGEVGIGNNEQFIRPWRCNGSNPDDPVVNYRVRGTAADPAAWFNTNIAKLLTDVNMLFIQDANELGEGTTWLRAKNFPKPGNPVFNFCAPGYKLGESLDAVRSRYHTADNKSYLPEDFYMKAVRAGLQSRYGIPCGPQNPPTDVTYTVSGTRATITWKAPGGLVSDYVIRVNKNGAQYAYAPENGTTVTGNSFSFDMQQGATFNGWMHARNICGTFSAATALPAMSIAPAPTSTPLPTPTTAPRMTDTPVPCTLKPSGDANCDGSINLNDFERFRQEYTGILPTKTSDFNVDGKVTLIDFETWRRNFK